MCTVNEELTRIVNKMAGLAHVAIGIMLIVYGGVVAAAVHTASDVTATTVDPGIEKRAAYVGLVILACGVVYLALGILSTVASTRRMYGALRSAMAVLLIVLNGELVFAITWFTGVLPESIWKTSKVLDWLDIAFSRNSTTVLCFLCVVLLVHVCALISLALQHIHSRVYVDQKPPEAPRWQVHETHVMDAPAADLHQHPHNVAMAAPSKNYVDHAPGRVADDAAPDKVRGEYWHPGRGRQIPSAGEYWHPPGHAQQAAAAADSDGSGRKSSRSRSKKKKSAANRRCTAPDPYKPQPPAHLSVELCDRYFPPRGKGRRSSVLQRIRSLPRERERVSESEERSERSEERLSCEREMFYSNRNLHQYA